MTKPKTKTFVKNQQKTYKKKNHIKLVNKTETKKKHFRTKWHIIDFELETALAEVNVLSRELTHTRAQRQKAKKGADEWKCCNRKVAIITR